jgi:hypothetical protein
LQQLQSELRDFLALNGFEDWKRPRLEEQQDATDAVGGSTASYAGRRCKQLHSGHLAKRRDAKRKGKAEAINSGRTLKALSTAELEALEAESPAAACERRLSRMNALGNGRSLYEGAAGAGVYRRTRMQKAAMSKAKAKALEHKRENGWASVPPVAVRNLAHGTPATQTLGRRLRRKRLGTWRPVGGTAAEAREHRCVLVAATLLDGFVAEAVERIEQSEQRKQEGPGSSEEPKEMEKWRTQIATEFIRQ